MREHLTWRTSSYSSDVGNCAEFAAEFAAVAVTAAGWVAFTADVRHGEFD